MDIGKISESIFKRSMLDYIDSRRDEVIVGPRMGEDSIIFKDVIKPGQEIVMTKWAGLIGTSIIAHEKEAELLERFTKGFVCRAKAFAKNLLLTKEVELALDIGVTFIINVGQGGVNEALWEIGEYSSLGIEVSIRELPIKQETIEICEFYDLNPYKLVSGGSVLIVTDNGSSVVKELQDIGVHASLIGRITNGKDKIIINGEYKRYLTPSKNDDLYKLLDLITQKG